MDSRPIRPEDLLSIPDYERVRAARRAEVIRLRELRRVELGNWVSVVFESRETVLYQIQEMLRIERITEPKAIQHEIDTYQDLLAGPGELSATLFIEIPNEAERAAALPQLHGVEGSLRLKAAGLRLPAEDRCPIDPAHARPQAACVYYLRFKLPPEAQAAVRGGGEVWLETEHPRYAHAARLRPEQMKELARDL